MRSNQNGFIGLLIIAIIAAASAVGGSALVENKSKQSTDISSELSSLQESIFQSKTESKESLPDISATNLAILNSDSQFSTFVSLVKSAGLTDTLTKGQYTIFAPTNVAFNRLAADKLNDISKNPEKLKAFITYHVVNGVFDARALQNKTSLQTVQGSGIGVSSVDSQIRVNGTDITKTNIKTSNGVIHVINDVLLPPQ